MYNLPLACMGKEIGQKIGSSVGPVEEVDVSEGEAGWGEYLRVRVTVDVTKPLARGRMLHLKGQSLWIDFKYERLPRFCFHCGVIRHGKEGCFSVQSRNKPGDELDYPYGQWLRVSYPNRKGGNVEQQWKKQKNSEKKTEQSDGVFSVFSGEMGLEQKGGEVGEGGCSPSHGAPILGDRGLNPNELILDEQVGGVDHSNLEGSRALVGRCSSDGEPLEKSREAVNGDMIEMTNAEKAIQIIGNYGGLSEQRDTCMEEGKSLDDSVDLQFEKQKRRVRIPGSRFERRV
jgi:hypothetical protein